MTSDTFVQITCRPAENVVVGTKTVEGLLISPEDAAFLRTLDGSTYIVQLECPGRRPLRARVQPILKRMVPVPYSDDWYISVTGTGTLYESRK